MFHVQKCFNAKSRISSFLNVKEMHIYLSVNVFSTKGLIGDTIFISPTGDTTAILRGHPSHPKV